MCLLKSEVKGSQEQPLFTVLKRSKTSGYQLSQPNGISPPSLHEARKNVQPTATLLVQLSENLTKPFDLSNDGNQAKQFEEITGEKNQNNSSHIDVTNYDTPGNSNMSDPTTSHNILEESPLVPKQKRYNWFKDYPPRRQGVASRNDSNRTGRKLIYMPFCDIGLPENHSL